MDAHRATEVAYRNGFEAGKTKWIRVKDALPDMLQRVLVYTEDGKYRIDFMYNETEFANTYPTHWMPLPEPPKEVKDG